ncbi:anti-sigma factor [Kribbella sp. NPDC056861]|uniref:anti-sigma factor n=1 Tax=Kribbella sp. NPDC056861 TaxID=3154857 RepID=UPI003419C6F9
MTESTGDDIHTLAGPYALDALDGDERRLFEQHLPQCVVCSAEVAELREAAVKLSTGVSMYPPPAMKSSVMASIAQVEQLPPLPADTSAPAVTFGSASVVGDSVAAQPAAVVARPGFGRRSLLALAAALVIVAGAGGIAVDQYRKNSATQDANDQIAAVLAQPDARTVRGVLTGGGAATVVASDGRDAAVVVLSGLPALPSKKTYQLWLIDSSKAAHSVGLASSSETKILAGGVTGKVAFGVTVEPDGGSQQPTMPAAVIIPI